jgi:hypothetical protein
MGTEVVTGESEDERESGQAGAEGEGEGEGVGEGAAATATPLSSSVGARAENGLGDECCSEGEDGAGEVGHE